MEKRLLFPLFILCFSIAHAQDNKFQIGPEVGINFSNYAFDDDDFDNSSITRLSFGVVGIYNFSEDWALKAKVKYDGKGSKANDNSFEDRLDYMTIPVMAELKLGHGKLFAFADLGIYTGFLLSAKSELANGEKRDIKNDVKEFDFGASLGLGLTYKASERMNITLSMDGQTGGIDVDGDNSDLVIRNNVLSVNIGMIFGV